MRMIIVLTIIMMLETFSAQFIGDHVCHEEKTYTVNVTHYYTRNLTVRNYKWCLNVPPRCSYYTVKLVNVSQIMPREVIDRVVKCCPGFKGKHNSCIPECGECYEGYCDGEQCICNPGYRGKSCNLECGGSNWGTNCMYNCTCQRGECNPKTGNCLCPSGWTGVACNLPCKKDYFGKNCSEKCSCNEFENCNPVNGFCELITTRTATTPISKSYGTEITTEEIAKQANLSTTTEWVTKSFENFTTLTVVNNGKFKTHVTEKGILEVNHDLLPNNDSTITGKEFDQHNAKEVEVLMSISSSKIMKPSKAKVNHIQLSVTTESGINYYQGKEDENYKTGEIIKGNEKDDNGFVYTMSAVFAVSLTIIIFAVVIIFAHHYKNSERKLKSKSQDQGNKGISSVSVYTTSVFHTPLPEPPTIENPLFSPPSENSSEILETRIVCSLNFQNQNLTDVNKEYLYDHPPSTGSYRAASIPEPPDMYRLSTHSIAEPLYDEIPCGITPVMVQSPLSYKSLYMNTFGKTHF